MNVSCGFAPARASRARTNWLRRLCAIWVAFFSGVIAPYASAVQNIWPGADPGSEYGCTAIGTFTVPNGAAYAQVTVIGQAGDGNPSALGGNGGIVTIVAAVTPGQKLYAVPTPGMFTVSGRLGSGYQGGVGSFVATSNPSASCAANQPPSADSLLVVAAGGGGGGAGVFVRGGSGGAAGWAGESGGNNNAVDGGGGDRGTLTGGGAGGAGGHSFTSLNGTSGSNGGYFAGGTPGNGWNEDGDGGGGGAGYYGGGGGGGPAYFGDAGGGGGGSNYVAPSIPTSAPSFTQMTGTVENGSTTRKALVEITPIFSTATTITSSPNPSAYGQSVTITANVTSSAGGYPGGGNVDITDGLTTIATVALVNGVATYSTSSLSQGQHPLQAIYLGYSSDSEIDQPSYSAGQIVGGIVTPYTQVVGAPLALPTILLNPSDQSATYGQTVEWQVAGNGNPTPTIQWQVSTDSGATFTDMAGQTNQFLILTAQVAMNGNRYRANFTNTAGTVATSAAALTVQKAGLQVVANDKTMMFGGSEPPLTVNYYGFVNGENTNVLGGTLACATTPATITATTPSGDYPINCSGLTSSNYTIYNVAGTLHILPPSPNISASPMPVSVPLGSTFAISAGKGASSKPIVFSVDASTTDSSCTVSATGVVSFVKTNYNSGTATCTIDLNQAGDGTYPASVQVQLSTTVVYYQPIIYPQPTPNFRELAAGGSTTITFGIFHTSPTPTVQWYYVAHGLYQTQILIPGATSTTLTLSNVTTSQDGNYYYALVTNNPGQSIYATNTDVSTNAVTLKVDGAPVIYQQPQSVEVHVGDFYNLQSGAQGSPTATPQWQISTDGGTTWNNDSDNPGANSTMIVFPPAGPGDDGTLYRVIYTNNFGSATSDAVVIHVDYHNITGNPDDASVSAGQPASFTAGFAGYPAATVQWQSAPAGTTTFSDIPGALASTYTITSVDPSQNGMRYRAVYTQTGALDGTIVTPSNYATLTVTLANPTFVATASAGGAFGKNVTDGAVLAAGAAPTGTITFKLFGVGDSTCAGASLFTSTVGVSGNGNYSSTSYEPPGVGTYYWTASYSGDAKNNAASVPCSSIGQSVTITQASQAIVFGALPQVVVSGTGNVTATGGGSNNAVTFSTNTPTICSVTSAGLVTGILAGQCEIDATQAGDSNYLPATANTTLQIGKNLVLTLVDDGNGYVQYSKPPVYTATLENNGTATPTNIMVSFGLSAGLDALNQQWTCNVVTGSVICPTSSASMTVSTIPPGSMLRWTLTVPVVAGTIDTTVRVDLSATNATSVSDTDVLVIFSGGFDP